MCSSVMASTSSVGPPALARKELFELWQTTSKKSRIGRLIDFIVTKFGVNSVNKETYQHLKTFVKNICEQFRKKWVAKHRRLDIFVREYSDWLIEPIQFPQSVLHALHIKTNKRQQRGLSGRPPKEFASCSERSKRRKVEHLVNQYDTEQLAFAASVTVRDSGKRHAANIIQEVATASPKRSTKYKRAMRLFTTPKKQMPYSGDEDLAFIVQNKLTVDQYKSMRRKAVDRRYDIYPSYNKIGKAKKPCYPTLESITITDVFVEIQLQELLHHTITRLCLSQKGVLESVSVSELLLYCKWGCDGSSGHSLYKQTFEDEHDTDEYMLSISFVPLRLVSKENTNKILWHNDRPSSTRLCRPIKLLFKQETTDLLKTECKKIEDQIKNLIPTFVELDTKMLNVTCIMTLTMVDTKVCNALTGTKSAQRCYICGITPKNMNAEISARPPINESVYSYGISSLHAWIRTFEAMLHIAYRLNIKKWQVKGAVDKAEVEMRKKEIQARFKREMGLIVDKSKPGAGNTNDGNTARRLFSDVAVTSQITGLNIDLLKRFDTLLRALSSGFAINTETFEAYAEETKRLYLQLYHWYPMPVTIHKILFHSVDIIKFSLLPIGQMSEEAQEARNKEIRQVRHRHTRKKSRVVTNMDMFMLKECRKKELQNRYTMRKWKAVGAEEDQDLPIMIKLIVFYQKVMSGALETGENEKSNEVNEASEVCKDRVMWRSVLSAYPARDLA